MDTNFDAIKNASMSFYGPLTSMEETLRKQGADLNAQFQQAPASGIVESAGGGTAPASSPAAPTSVGIVGAESAQLNNPTQWNVTDDQTVEGRIDRIIRKDSPLQQQARTRALEGMNARGLGNSTLAITAGESALYDAALPIAQADASTAAKAAGYNADQYNQFAVRNADAENQFKLADKNNQVQLTLADKQAQQQRDLALINRETQLQVSKLDAQNKAQADELARKQQLLLETNQQAASAFNTAMSAINNIQNNNQMDAATKTQAVATIWRDLQAQMRVMGAVVGLDLTSQLNFANYPGFDANGNFVGFDANGNTATADSPAVTPGTTTTDTTTAPAPAPTGADSSLVTGVWV